MCHTVTFHMVCSHAISNILFYDLCFTARQDYFTHFEPSQSLGGANAGKAI